jgi:hypothetical protein
MLKKKFELSAQYVDAATLAGLFENLATPEVHIGVVAPDHFPDDIGPIDPRDPVYEDMYGDEVETDEWGFPTFMDPC